MGPVQLGFGFGTAGGQPQAEEHRCKPRNGLLHLAQYTADGALQSAEIKRKTMEAAICVRKYLIPHAGVAYAEMGADGVIQDTRYILRWIKEKLHKSFTKRTLFQETKGRFKRVEALGQPLGLLKLSDLLDVSIDTVRKWRQKGRGPAFIRAEGRGGSVRYDVRDVEKYLAARRVSHEQVASEGIS